MVKSLRLFSIFLLPSISLAASFDCARATSQIERLICSDPSLSDADERLSVAYFKALKKAANPNVLKQQQRDWLAGVRNRCDVAPCIMSAYSSRIDELALEDNATAATPVSPFLTPGSAKLNEQKQYLTLQGGAYAAQIAGDGSGNVLVVWDRSAGNWDLKTVARAFQPGTGWGPEYPFFRGTNTFYRGMVAMNTQGNAITAWQEYENVFASSHSVGSGWGAKATVTDKNAAPPVFAMNEIGNAIAVWTKWNKSCCLYASRYEPKNGWFPTEATSASNDIAEVRDQRVGMDDRGNAIAVWKSNHSEIDGEYGFNVWANRYVRSKGWGAFQRIDADDSQRKTASIHDIRNSPSQGPRDDDQDESRRVEHIHGLKIVVDRPGNAIAVWIEQYGRFENVWANRYDVQKKSWGKALRISRYGTPSAPVSADIAMNAQGSAVIVWNEFGRIVARWFSESKWGKPQIISVSVNGLAGAFGPSVAVDSKVGLKYEVQHLPGGNVLRWERTTNT